MILPPVVFPVLSIMVTLSVIGLNVIIVSAIMLNVMAPASCTMKLYERIAKVNNNSYCLNKHGPVL